MRGKSQEEAVRNAAQEIAKGNCHHTTLGELRTVEAILDDVFNAGVRYGNPPTSTTISATEAPGVTS